MTSRYEGRRRLTRRRGLATSRTTPVDGDTVAHGVRHVGVVSANATGPTSARWDYTPSYWHHPARGPGGPTTLRGPIARRGSLNAEPPDSARPDSTPRSGLLKPRRGPLLLPPSILKAPALCSSPPTAPTKP